MAGFEGWRRKNGKWRAPKEESPHFPFPAGEKPAEQLGNSSNQKGKRIDGTPQKASENHAQNRKPPDGANQAAFVWAFGSIAESRHVFTQPKKARTNKSVDPLNFSRYLVTSVPKKESLRKQAPQIFCKTQPTNQIAHSKRALFLKACDCFVCRYSFPKKETCVLGGEEKQGERANKRTSEQANERLCFALLCFALLGAETQAKQTHDKSGIGAGCCET